MTYDGPLRPLDTSVVMICACFAEDDLILASSIPPGSRNDDNGRHVLNFPRRMDIGLEPGTQWSRRVALGDFL